MNYPYRKFPLEKPDPVTGLDFSWRPALRVILWHNHQRTVSLVSILDTGADHCIFDAQIGEDLGIDIAKGKHLELRGIGGGPVPAFMHILKVTVAASNYTAPIVFAYNIQMTGILGQSGFFDHFVATFDWTPEPPCFDVSWIPRN